MLKAHENQQLIRYAPEEFMLTAASESKVRVAISGIGMVTPCGADRETSWRGLLTGQSVIRWLTPDEHRTRDCDINRTRLAGAPAVLPVGADPSFAFAMDVMARCAVREALEDADLPAVNLDRERTGVVVGTSKGSLGAWHQLLSQPVRADVQRTLWKAGWSNSPALSLASDYELYGPVLVPVAACATGLLSIGRGVQLIQDGYCDVVLAGSVDDSLSEILWASYRRLGVLARVKETDPSRACRPFDRERHGFLIGSGAGIVVLERWEHAAERGHPPYAEWLAGAMASDSTALTQMSADAAGLTHLIRNVLNRGQVEPREVDYINLHGTGTRDNDRYETQGIRQAMGSAADSIPCSSLKGTIGHLLGGAGSVEFAAMLLAMRDGLVPPTANLTHPDPQCNLDYTPGAARPQRIRTALKLSLGFGGHLVAGLVRNCRL